MGDNIPMELPPNVLQFPVKDLAQNRLETFCEKTLPSLTFEQFVTVMEAMEDYLIKATEIKEANEEDTTWEMNAYNSLCVSKWWVENLIGEAEEAKGEGTSQADTE